MSEFLKNLNENLEKIKKLMEVEDLNNAYEFLNGTIKAVNEKMEGKNE